MYQAYTRDMTRDEVIAAFVAKYGHEPERVWQEWDWLAGPVEEHETN